MKRLRTFNALFLFLSIVLLPAVTQTITNSDGQQAHPSAYSLDSVSTGEDNANQAAAINECTPNMSESECDRKIERDLALAVRNKTKGCLFEPTWRPTHFAEATIHVSEVNDSTIFILIGEKHYAFRNSACQDQGGNSSCSQWKPKVGMDYHGSVTDQPEYLNDCLHRVLPARRDVCIDFGKTKQETFWYGVSSTSEFEVCYSVSATHVNLSPAHVPVTTTTTTAPTSTQAPASKSTTVPLSNDNYYRNSAGDRVHAPANAPSVPTGATAQCGDGTYSFSQHRSGTCSHHGGVAKWL
jgi:hypothetical protein